MKPLIVSSGEPAGIGPDLCLDLVACSVPLVVLGDLSMLRERAVLLGKSMNIEAYHFEKPYQHRPGYLSVCPIPCPVTTIPGTLNPAAASYVMEMLSMGASFCMKGHGAALVTAPVHKANMNAAGIRFTGHTEFFSEISGSKTVMLLVSKQFRVSLVTTHLPLHEVPKAITQQTLQQHLDILYRSLQEDFGISNPRLKIMGLNPHSGESGYLGTEEQRVIEPVIEACRRRGMAIEGPCSADTAFVETEHCDALVAMYHDQGLPTLKYASFGEAVNVTCGLPFIRTSVDHGTALHLAGTGRASSDSLVAAIHLAAEIIKHRV